MRLEYPTTEEVIDNIRQILADGIETLSDEKIIDSFNLSPNHTLALKLRLLFGFSFKEMSEYMPSAYGDWHIGKQQACLSYHRAVRLVLGKQRCMMAMLKSDYLRSCIFYTFGNQGWRGQGANLIYRSTYLFSPEDKNGVKGWRRKI